MTASTLLFILGFVIGGVFLFYAGVYSHDINKKLDFLLDHTKQPEPEAEAFVTHTHPGFTNENMISSDSSSIITPKTPQQVAFEEEEALRKLNLRK